MRKLIYSMAVSLDGYINDPAASLNWVRVDEPYHRFANALMRDTALSIYGTRMWQTMVYWDTAADQEGEPDFMIEFAELWKPAEKLVFSHSLADTDMRAGAKLRRDSLVDAVRGLKAEDGGDIAVSGATITAPLLAEGLVDEVQPFFVPVILGGGTPFLAANRRLDFELLDLHRFGSGMVYHRYARR